MSHDPQVTNTDHLERYVALSESLREGLQSSIEQTKTLIATLEKYLPWKEEQVAGYTDLLSKATNTVETQRYQKRLDFAIDELALHRRHLELANEELAADLQELERLGKWSSTTGDEADL